MAVFIFKEDSIVVLEDIQGVVREAAKFFTDRAAGGIVLNYEGQELPMELNGNVVAGNSIIPRLIVEQYLH